MFIRIVLAIAELKSSFVDLLGSAARNAVLATNLRGKINLFRVIPPLEEQAQT